MIRVHWRPSADDTLPLSCVVHPTHLTSIAGHTPRRIPIAADQGRGGHAGRTGRTIAVGSGPVAGTGSALRAGFGAVGRSRVRDSSTGRERPRFDHRSDQSSWPLVAGWIRDATWGIIAAWGWGAPTRWVERGRTAYED